MSELSLCRLQTSKGQFDGRVILYNCLPIIVIRSGLDNKQKYIRQENMLELSVFEFAGSAQSCLDSAWDITLMYTSPHSYAHTHTLSHYAYPYSRSDLLLR